MSNKKFELEKFNNYFTLAFILSVVFIIYLVEVVFFKNEKLSEWKINLVIDMWVSRREYKSLSELLTAWGFTVFLGYIFGFLIASYGWYTERKKRIKAEGQANGLKGKLSKVENERDFYKKKYEILEKGINSSAPPADKKPNNKGKPKNKKSSVIILLIVLLVGGGVYYKLFYAGKGESQIVQVKIGIPEKTDNSNTQK